jgi:hypothetical protein
MKEERKKERKKSEKKKERLERITELEGKLT